MAFAVLRRRPL